ncbi:DUF748 domain-containing protein [Fundidesulfovibrio terrae]|uniref:DUF748 domain-containing protein n=1 Tax=Fundidesulfovibrio terrae TaxID=2922866 RepID=UPI001FAFBA90|nr:DUF748 domain-containing protein [Fundidesulfovibrio terrae]
MSSTSGFLSSVDAWLSRIRHAAGELRSTGLGTVLGASALGFLVLAHGVLLMALAGSVVAPFLVQKYLQDEASRALGREIRLDSLRLNPFTFDLTASGLSIMDKDGGEPLAGFTRLELNLDPSKLAGSRLAVSRFILENPTVRLARDGQGRLNIADLIPEAAPSAQPQPQTFELVPAGLLFSLSDVRITDGRVSFDDARTGIRQEVRDLHFFIDSLSSDQPGLREIFSSGGQLNESNLTLSVKADLSGQTPEAEARLTLKNVVFRHYTPYLLALARPLDLKMDEAGVRVRVVLPAKGQPGLPFVDGDARIAGVALGNGDERAAELESLDVQGASFDPASGAVTVERVVAQSPMVRIRRDEAGIVDLLAMLQPPSGERPREESGPAPRLRVLEARLKGGRADLVDEGLGISLALTDVEAGLKGLDTQGAALESLSVEAAGDHFKRLALTAAGSYSPAGLTGKAVMEGADLAKPFPLLKRLMPKLALAGTAGFDLAYSVDEKDGRFLPKLKGGLDIHDFKAVVEGQAKPLFSAGTVGVTGIDADVDARKVLLGQVRLSGGGAALARGEKGAFPALEILPAGSGSSSGAGGGGQAGSPWTVLVDQLGLSDFSAEYQDAAGRIEQRVDLDELAVKNISSSLEKPLAVSVKGALPMGDAKAPFELSGELRPKEPGASLTVNLTSLPLAELSRLAPGLPVAVLSGRAGLSGQAVLSLGQTAPSGSFTGDASLTDLKLARPGGNEPWASLAGLSVKGASATLSPLEFKAAGVVLDSPWLVLVLDKDGKPVLPFETASGQDKAKQGVPLPGYGVDRIEIRGGKVDVTAEGFDPALSGQIADIALTVSDVRPGQPAKLAGSFVLGHSGRFQTEGQAGWVSDAPMLDMRATLENFDLGELSPVSRKFTGFPINRGKLGLKLDYKAGAKSLDLKNKIVAMGIQLGRKSGQPGGKDVPLDLAVSLLSDAKGVIDLDIPVKGDLTHAKADLRDVISTAMAGAFARILFSPLAFLNVAKGGGRTAAVGFTPGTAELTADGKKLLGDLAAVLVKRPMLKLEVLAYADPASEADAFARALAAKAPPAPPATPASKATKGRPAKEAQPAEAAPAPSKAPSAEEWAGLARARWEAVRGVLTTQGGLPDSRIFPMSGDFLHPPKMEGAPAARADVTLTN